MDLDDLDGLDAPKPAPSRVSKFAPRSSKLKPQPKQGLSSNPQPPPFLSKEESPESVKLSEPDLQSGSVSEKKEEELEVKPEIHDIPKTETPGSSEAVKMEIDGGNNLDVVEDELVVVREFDVFFTPSIGADSHLYVMQYPLRSCWRPYELDERCEEVRLKPETNEAEIDLSIDDSTNWDADFANKLKMTKQTLKTSGISPPAAGICVGVLIRNKLYLNPIHAVMQLRPSLEHLNTGGPKRKNVVTSGTGVEIKLESSNEGKPVAPLRKQNSRMQPGIEQKQDLEESWVPLKYHGSKSDLTSSYLQKMVTEESSCIEFAMNPHDYMRTLCPGASNNNIKPQHLSKRDLLSLPLEERIKKLLVEGEPTKRLCALMHSAPDDLIEDVLTLLQRHGHLIQGRWVPKTTLLFPKSNEGSKLAARDYVLLLLSKSAFIRSTQLNVPFKKDMMAFLAVFAVERPSLKDWKFKEQTDASFLKQYPDIVEKQEQSWKAIETRFTDMFSRASKNKPGLRNQIAKPSMPQHPAKSLNSDKSASVVLSRRTMTNETREALRKALPKVFSNHKVCSFQLICRSLRELALSLNGLPKADSRSEITAAFGADSPEELQEVINEVAVKIHDFYVLKSSPDHPEYDPLRNVVIDLLMARGPDAKIKKTEVVELARRDLKREITNNEYNKVMTDLCESKGSAWVLKSGDGKP